MFGLMVCLFIIHRYVGFYITNYKRETTFDIYDVDNKIPIYCMFKDIQVATRQWAYVSQ